jgi:sulfonate transport system substrate-binding protein
MSLTPSPFTALSRRKLGLSLAYASLVAACAPPRRRPRTLRIGYQKNGVLLCAKSRGLIDKALPGTTVEWSLFPSGPPMLEAMSAGAVDFGATGDTPPIFAQAASAPLVYAAYQPLTGVGEGVVTPPGSPLTTGKDLKGKRIAVTKGSSAHLLLIRALRSAGLSWGDVTPVFLTPSDAASAFGSGSIDAWSIWDPYLALAQRDQKARVLVSGAVLPQTDAFYLASAKLAHDSPDLLRDFLDALRVEAAWGQAHQDEMVKIISDANHLPADVVLTSLRRGPLAVEPMTAAAVARQQAGADTFADLHIIPAHIDIASVVWRDWKPQS